MEQATRDWLTVNEVAEELGVCRRTVRNLIYRGQLPATNFGARLTRVHRGDLEEYARDRGTVRVA